MWFNLRCAVLFYCLSSFFSVNFENEVENDLRNQNQIALAELNVLMTLEVVFVVNALPFAFAVCLVLDELDTDWLLHCSSLGRSLKLLVPVAVPVPFGAVTRCSKHAIVLRKKYFQGRGMQSCFLRCGERCGP